MAASVCLTCLWEQETGRTVNDALTKVEWAEEVGVSEGSIRRHLRHDTKASDDADADLPAGESESHTPNGSSYVRFSQVAWGYEDYREFIRSTGQDPDMVTFAWGWTSNPGGGFWNKLNNVRPIAGKVGETHSLSHLYAEAKKHENTVIATESKVWQDRAIVVALADWQLGKTGRRGGTDGTLARLASTRSALAAIYAERKPSRIVLVDLGDGIEGFESGGDPQFTNDLSLPDQLDAYATEMFKFVIQAAQYAPTEVGAVSSNHAAWRRGKQNLGKPNDDFGLYVHKQVAKVVEETHYSATWHLPADYDESILIDVMGVPIGAVHGNQFGPGKAIDWWQAQAFGSQAITRADVLLTGHYHSFGAGVAGMNPFTDRERMWLGAPTVDPGSDWYRAIRGRDSLPGTLIFEVTPDGFDLGSLRII